jgi:hypothetical protein
VEVYRPKVTTVSGEIPRCALWFIDNACGGVKKWWKGRKGKPLAELQLEGIEWALRQKRPENFDSEKQWAQAKEALRKMARDIRASKKPIKVEHGFSFCGE